MTLNPKQAAFVREYLIDRNAAQAAIRAGYSENGANSKGSQLLAIISISDAIEAGEIKHAEICAVTRESIMAEYEIDRKSARELDNPQLNVAISATEKISKMFGLEGATKLEIDGKLDTHWTVEVITAKD